MYRKDARFTEMLRYRNPGQHCWDAEDARLLVCEALRPQIMPASMVSKHKT